jgi:regulatory protein
MPFRQKPKKPRTFLNEAGLYDYALKALGRTMRTEAELRRLMKQRTEPGDSGLAIVDNVIARLKEHGYLDDKSFAEIFARLRVENEKLGSRTVRQKLTQKGVPAPIVNETIEARYAGTDEEALARQHIERKRLKKPENEKETARILRRLIAAGFSMRTIYKILRQWDVPEETLSALDTIQDSLEDEPPGE